MASADVCVGHMNVHHQRVVARARMGGVPAAGFVMWCSKCGHRYVADCGEVIGRRCPNHDHGAPAISCDDRVVDGCRAQQNRRQGRCSIEIARPVRH